VGLLPIKKVKRGGRRLIRKEGGAYKEKKLPHAIKAWGTS
jgi:hypothetical protein